MQEVEGRIISHYRLQKQVDIEGSSESYLATDRRTGQIVVLKLIQHSDNASIERLLCEIQALSKLKHEHILSILDYGKHDARYYIVTPYTAYDTLEHRFNKSSLSLENAGNILKQLAYTLQFAHNHGIKYYHVKPSDVLLKDGHHIYLTIESLSRNLQNDQSLAETGCIEGTAEYVTPLPADEQATLADETYSLSILLCQMLTGGSTPSQALSPGGMLSQQTVDLLLPPSECDLSLPRAIEDVLLHALAKNPQERFQTPLEFAQEYQNALTQFRASTLPVNISNTTKGPKASLVQRLPQNLRNKRLLASAIALAVMISLLGFLIAGMYGQTAHQGRQATEALGKTSPSVTVSPPTQNKSPNTNYPPGATGQTYGASPTVQPSPTAQPSPTVQPSPTAQPYPIDPAAPPMKHPVDPGKGKNSGPPKPRVP